MFVGIDVGSDKLNCVRLNAIGQVVSATLLLPNESQELLQFTEGAEIVAIDSPLSWSDAPHVSDSTLPNKFREARCAEVALLELPVKWPVPWATPVGSGPRWMQVGIATSGNLKEAGKQVVEVFPYAAFRSVSGGMLPKKSTSWGIRDRAFLLRRLGVAEADLELWSHDFIDACMAAVIARDVAGNEAVAVSHSGKACDDGSCIYLPHDPGGTFVLPHREDRYTWHSESFELVKRCGLAPM